MSVNSLLSAASESLRVAKPYNNVYYDSSNTKKSMYNIERDNKQKIPFNSLNFGTTQIPFVIQNAQLLGPIIVSLTFPAGTLNPLPALNSLKKVSYQMGNSNIEDMYKGNLILSQLNQFNTLEKRQQYLANAGGAGGAIVASTTYYAVLSLPWSRMTRKLRCPIDTKMLSSNITIYIDLEDSANVYSSVSPPAALVNAYIQPTYWKFLNSNDNMKLIGYDMEKGEQIQHIYTYPIVYEKPFNKVVSTTGTFLFDISGFLPGNVNSISFYLVTTFPNSNRLSNIILTYNSDVLSRYDNNTYEEFNMIEKQTLDQYSVNSVVGYFYEIPLGQHNIFNNINPSDFEHGMALNSQTLQLQFDNSATGTLFYTINYRKVIAFDGLTANII